MSDDENNQQLVNYLKEHLRGLEQALEYSQKQQNNMLALISDLVNSQAAMQSSCIIFIQQNCQTLIDAHQHLINEKNDTIQKLEALSPNEFAMNHSDATTLDNGVTEEDPCDLTLPNPIIHSIAKSPELTHQSLRILLNHSQHQASQSSNTNSGQSTEPDNRRRTLPRTQGGLIHLYNLHNSNIFAVDRPSSSLDSNDGSISPSSKSTSSSCS